MYKELNREIFHLFVKYFFTRPNENFFFGTPFININIKIKT